MCRTEIAVKHVSGEGDIDIPRILKITDLMWRRIQENDHNIKPWLMSLLIQEYKINPLYIYGLSDKITIH